MHTLDILRALRAGAIGIDDARQKLASAMAPAPSSGTHARGVVVSSVQAPDAVALSEWRVGPPAAGEVAIQVRASAINFADLLCINGLYPTMPAYPFVPGFEVAGVVAAVGGEVAGLAVGDAVIALAGERLGGHASHVNVPAGNAIGKPDGLSFEDACSLPVVFSTVYYAFELAALSATEHVLVQSAAGGCGLMAVQLAHERQSVVYGTSSRPEKLDLLRSIGVRQAINYRTADLAREIRRITGGRGVDVVLNTLGGAAMQQGLDSLAPFGRYLEIAVHALKAGPKLDVSRLVQNQTFHSIDLRRAGLGGRLAQRALLDAMVSMVRSRRIVPIVSRVYPFHQIGDAFQHVAGGSHVGKVVVSHTADAVSDRTADCVAALADHKRRCDEAGAPRRALVQIGAAGGRAPRAEGIAIVGMAGRFPQANDVEALWENIAQGRDGISEVPPERWPVDRFYDPKRQTPGRSYSRWMGVVENAEDFDPLFFNISPAEAAWMDPQQRMFLEECWHCLEDAAIRPSTLSGARCGVFVGCGPSEYGRDAGRDGLHVHSLTGGASSILAARISYFLNLTGPCLALETACSSSLVAIAQACDSLVAGHCDLALAGGVHLMFGPSLHVMTSDAGMLSEHGRCFTFDARANGFVPGEGAGVLLLKRLPDAVRAGDSIAGIIRGWGVNHDGRTNGITAPSVKSQAALEKEVYRRFGIDPGTITLVEAHGTGTALGDPIELEALAEAFRAFTARVGYCAVGSIKSNIGHLMTAAGVAGVVKALLALRHRMLPPTINFETPNPHLPLEGSPFFVSTRLRPWAVEPGAPRRAAVSSFGFSGTNAHLVIEEAVVEEAATGQEPPRDRGRPASGNGPLLFPLSAKSIAQLKRAASNLCRALVAIRDDDLEDLAYTLQVGREPMEHRLAILADSRAALERRLEAYAGGEPATGLLTGRVAGARAAAVGASASAESSPGPGMPAAGAMPSTPETEAEWRRIAVSWLEGGSIDWDRFYAGEKPRRVRLPGYPFAHKRYTLPAANDGNEADAAREPLAPPDRVDRATTDLGSRPAAGVTSQPRDAARARDDVWLFRPRWIAAESAATGSAAADTAIGRHLILCEPEAADRAAIEAHSASADCTMLHAADSELSPAFEQFSLQVLDVLQRIQRARADRPVLVQLVGRPRSELLLHGLGGLLRTAELESARLHGQVIDLGEPRSSSNVWSILEAEAREPRSRQVRYRGGTRWVADWEPVERNSAAIPWKAGGVYVISGGAGRLGVLMAEEIARRAPGATLVLLGRRASLHADLEVRGRLEALGASVRYRQVDIADRAGVERVIHETAAEFGAVHGIVHTAGVLRDGYIYKKQPGDLRAVLAPKVAGIVNLDLASRSQPLDVFIAFSSFAGAMANAGQADYVAANAFMDAYARHRAWLVEAGERCGRTLSVNWPLWRDGGMRVDAATERRMTRDLGLVPLETGAAFDAMYRCLAGADPQVLVLSGDEETIGRRLFGRGVEPEPQAPIVKPAAATAHDAAAPDGAGRMKVERVLVQAVSALLGIDAHEIDRDTELGELGCDSIAFAKLAASLAEQHGVELAPVVFFEHRTINALAMFLLAEHPSMASRSHSHTLPNPEPRSQNPEPRTQNPEPNPEHEPGTRNPEPGTRVAVIGISACFPKAPNLRAFWDNLVNGRDCIDEIPASRWDWREYDGGPGDEGNVTWARHGAFIDGVDEFDPFFFGISPAEAELMDPQQRLLMTHVWAAIEDAGYAPHSLAGSNTAIFVGTGSTGYSALLDRAHAAIKGYSSTGSVPSVGPNRISFLLDLHGPSEPIETACSSSLVAVHRALLAIEQGACDAAVVGGVNTIVTPDAHIGFAKAGMLSPSGRCRTFSDRADGYVRGEGVGMLVLKRLSLAERDGDHIYAVLLGSAENHGGRATSLTAPNPVAQAALLEAAYEKAGVDPRTVGYVEAHGTGTPLGDPIEIDALKRAFAALGRGAGVERSPARCGIGSVKTNIGHLELAAGIAGLIKAVLQLHHKTLVKSLHCDRLNPHIVLDDGPFYIVDRTMPWREVRDERGEALPRRAGVSSFGFGGVNAHVVVEEYVDARARERSSTGEPSVIVLSARIEAQLRQQAEQLLDALGRGAYSDADLADIAFTLQAGRDAMQERLGFVARSLGEVKATLGAWLGGAAGIEGLYRGRANRGNDALSAFAVDEDLHGAIDAWFRKQKYDALLDFWTKGMEVDWRTLHADGSRRRLSLPAYPFAKDRYWVPRGDGERGAPARRAYGAETRYLHPLLHQNTSTLAGQRYTTAFTGDEPFLADHVVRGHRILSGVAHLEIARAAFQVASGLDPGAAVGIRLLDVSWRRPLLVGARGARIEVALDVESDGRVGFRVLGRGHGPKAVEHLYSQGRAERLTEAAPHIDLAALRDRCGAPALTAAECYAAFSEAGIAYGAAHQGLASVRCGAREVLGEIVLPASMMAGRASYVLHPSLMDSALQAIIGLRAGSGNAALAIPFGLARLDVFAACPDRLWSWVRPAAVAAAEAGVETYDVDLVGDDGVVCVRVTGLVLRALAAVASAPPPAEPVRVPAAVRPAAPVPASGAESLAATVARLLRREISDTLKVGEHDIDEDTRLEEYGFDSITLTELVNRLNHTYRLELAPTVFFEYPTIAELAPYLAVEYARQFSAHAVIGPGASAPPPEADACAAAPQTEAAAPPVETPAVPVQQAMPPGRRPAVRAASTEGPHVAASEPVAVIGMSGRFPMAADLDAYWTNLVEGRDCIQEIPPSRWDWRACYGDPAREPNKTNVKWGGFIEGVDEFDPAFFGIPPAEAEVMDPQQRLLMLYVWQALEDAAYAPADLAGSRTGVFVGTGHTGYGTLIDRAAVAIRGYSSTGAVPSIGPNRISHFLNLRGPSEPIETACSSSLVALHRAMAAIRAGECEMAIAGGLNTIVTPDSHIGFSKAGMLSPTGQCRAFGEGADGYVRGEGAGMLVLKPLARAEADGDRIYGVLRGSAVGHNGRTSSLTAPSARAQAELLELAYLQAGVDPRTVTYIEAHGTGTPLGDPIEIDGLKAGFGALYARTGARDAAAPHCGLGSVKTNIGHLELAAGIAGVIKVLLQLKHRMLAPSRHSDRVNPYIDLDGTPFFLVREAQPWKALLDESGTPLPRRAGVSSFGFGGVNAHIVIEEHLGSAPARASGTSGEPRAAHAIVLSARNDARLRERAERLLNVLERGELAPADLPAVAYTLQVGRDAMEERLGFVVHTLDELRDSLRAYVGGRETPAPFHSGHAKRHKEMVSVIAADEAFQSTVRSWIHERKLATLLSVWTKGLHVPWRALHGTPPPLRISLPGYPFARERCWVAAAQSPAPRVPAPSPVPLRTGEPETHPVLLYQPVLLERAIGDPEPALALDDHVVLLCGLRGVPAHVVESEIPGARCRLVPVEDGDAAQVFLEVSTSVFEEIRLAAADAGRRVLIQAVASADLAHGCLRGLGALARSARLDHGHLFVQSIEIGGMATPGGVLDAIRQARPEAGTPQFIWSGGRSLEVDWEEIARDRPAAPPWKSGGVYLITGGAGRIGRHMARDIAAAGVDAAIVLAGRSAIHEDWAVRLDLPPGSRARVEYRAVDVTQHRQCAALVRSILQQYGRLDGIVHAAGMVRDRLLGDKSTAEWREVLAPKVAGLVNLDEAAGDVSLDFFVAFSSLSAAVGNRGQSDYATANAFVDAYMRHRRDLAAGGARHGASLSLLWPLWRDGGMRVDRETEMRMWSGAGLVPLETAAGLEALYYGVASGSGHLLVAAGERARIAAFLRGQPQPPTSPATPAATTPPVAAPADGPVAAPAAAGPARPSDEALLAALRQELRAIVSSLLKIDAAAIGAGEEWNEYGFDSITLTELTHELNRAYGLELLPVVLFEHPTLDALARHLLPVCRDRVTRQPEALSKTPFAPSSDDSAARQATIPMAPVPVAVIGISGCFPMAPDLDAFWDNLVNGRDCISEVPLSRWDWRAWYGDPRTEPNKTRIKWGGFIDSIDEFDPLFFGISPAEAEVMDPQQRLLMTHVWQAIEDAGHAPQSLSGTRTGIFVGTGNTGYGSLVERAQLALQGYSSTGAVPSIGPNRVSHLLNLRGPSEPIETACSSSLVALHHAMQALAGGTCDAAIAGGVNTIPVPGGHIGFEKAGMLSPDGKCRPFSDRANGYVRGEGVGMLFLKRLADAEAANDHIYGVIRTSAENHGGRASSLTAPNPAAQAELIAGAYTKADIDPRTVGYIEAHGTGTTLGDPVEIAGLARAFVELAAVTGGEEVKTGRCALGSVKSNVGHLELAAGVAGVLKVLLQLKHRKLVPTLHCETLNPYLRLDDTPFTIVRELQDWTPVADHEGRPLPRRAGVSSFGFGGVNAHVLIEEYVATPGRSAAAGAEAPRPAVAVVLSARTPDRLRDQAARLLTAIRSGRVREGDLVDAAYTLQVGRDAMDERLALVVDLVSALESKLQAFLDGRTNIADLVRGRVRRGAGGEGEPRGTSDSAADAWRAGDPRPMAALWVNGAQIDWDRLYTHPRPRRLSLPTYPFARNRYWVSAARAPLSAQGGAAGTAESEGRPSEPGERIAEGRSRIAENEERIADRGEQIAGSGSPIADRGERIAEIRDLVRESIAAALRIEERDLQDDRSLAEYGVDSIVAAGVIDAINERCGSELNTIVLFDYNTVSALSEHLAASHPGVAARLDEASRRDEGKAAGRAPDSAPRPGVAPRSHVESPDEPIAVVGFSGRYAGSASLDELWTHLVEGHDLVGDVTRWDLARHYAQALGSVDRGCLRGSFIDGIDRFDADFFGISALEARCMDPQQRLFLEEAWTALEEAGYAGDTPCRERCGVFVGCTVGDYEQLFVEEPPPQAFWGNAGSVIPARIAYFLNLHGPAVAVDTACSSSLVAIHLASQSLWRREIDMALAGGVHVQSTPRFYVLSSRGGMLSPTGRCHSFGDEADGFVPGEGVGVVVLKRLGDALADGDHLYGVIRGSGMNQDGATTGITAPSANAQERLLCAVYERYGIDPERIQMVEAHGTGTKLGDPIEFEALTRAFRRFTTKRAYCALGSIKTNLGHTATAAGVTGVIKALLSLQHRTIPASLHGERPNRRLDIGDSPFFLNTRSRAWEVAPRERRCAAVSSFGFSGTNAHLVLEEPPAAPERIARRLPAWLVALSARTAGELRRQAERLCDCMARAADGGTRLDCADISYTLLLGRRHFGHRLACLVRDERELAALLTKWLAHGSASHAYVSHGGETNRREQPEIVRFGNRCLRECAEGADETQYREKLAAAAELYVQGHTLDFAALFAGGSYRRLSLPTYPFTRESHWVQTSTPPLAATAVAGARLAQRAPVEPERTPPPAQAHAALRRVPSDSSEARYVATFTGDEVCLTDHVVNGRRVLPAAAYLEIARAAAVDALGSAPSVGVRLWNTVWSRPVVVGGEGMQVHVRLRRAREERDGAAYEVFTRAEGANAQEVLHCQGRARLITPPDFDREPQPAAEDIAALRAACSRLTVGKDELYSRYGQLGIHYGPAHRAVDTVFLGDGQALAELSLPAEAARDGGPGWLHPSLVDGALQTVLALMTQGGEVTPGLPFALEDLRVYRPCSSRMFVASRASSGSPPSRDARVRRFDIDLCDESGALCATLRGFSIRAGGAKGPPMPGMPAPPGRQDTVQVAEPLTLVPIWAPTTFERIAPSPSSADRVVLIGAGERLVDHLRPRYPALVPMTIGSTETIDDIAEALTRLLPIDHLVWIAPETWRQMPDGAGIVAAQQAGVLQLFRVIKALIGLGLDRSPLGVTAVTYRSQSIHAQDPIDPTHAAVHGLVGSMAKECDTWKVRLVDLPSSDAWLDEDLSTVPFDPKGNALVCRARQWYRQAVIPVDAESMQGDAPSLYRRGGTYVVLGGAGGIGEAWTDYVVRRYQAQVVWIGRRPLDAAIEAKAAALAAHGPAPVYISADATDRTAVERAYGEIGRRFGAVHGVVHSALVLRDQALANLTETQFAEALAAKVNTSVHAAEVFQAGALDFFLCFSSLNSFSKWPWQSNYAAACVFKDAYARHLAQARGALARVMNWGYWGTVGIVASELYRRRMARHGIGSIEAPDGMDALEKLLRGPLDQVCFVKTFRRLPGVEYAERAMCHPSPGGAPHWEALAARIASGAADRSRAARELAGSIGGVAILHRMLTDLLFAGLRRIGLDAGGLSLDDVQRRCGIAPRYRNWLRESLAILARERYLSVEDDRYSVARHDVPPLEALWEAWARQKEAWASSPLESTMMLLAEPAMTSLHDVVGDLRPATDVLFPRGSLQLVERLYKHNPITAYFSGALADCVVACLLARTEQAPLSRIRILEIGAGTGAATVAILEKLRPYQDSIAEYCFTDLSQAFLINARKTYGSWNPFLRYAIVNIEQPLERKVELGSYDVVVASNVLHATANVRHALRHAKAALKRGGAIVLNELTLVPLFSHLTFGLLDGWWRYEDAPIREPGGPVVAAGTWKHILESEGFRHVTFAAETAHELGQQIIVAESDGVSRHSQLPTPDAQLPTPNPQVPTPNTQRPTPNAAVVVTAAPAAAADARPRVRAVMTRCLAATLQVDVEKLRHERFADYGIDSILAVKLMTAVGHELGLMLETTLVVEHDTIDSLTTHLCETYAVELSAARAPAPVVAHVSVEGPSAYYRVVLERPGTIDDIKLVKEESRRLAAHELRVATRAFSLNFGDLLCVRGLYPTMPPYPFTPGFEASGVIVEAGTAVTAVAPGDAVIVGTGDGLGGHASMIICSEDQVFPKPRSLGFEEASAMPAVSITMIEAFRRAEVQRGERILIQTATGGTGLIAVQLAAHHGAEVFATAGSPQKLEYLERLGVPHRINYRASDFEAEVMRLTRGEGVDVVINTLPGNALQKGLRCLRSGGRYVEIAMTALKGARAVDLSVLNDNQAFHSIDLRKLARANPRLMKAHRDEFVRLVDAGCLRATIYRTVPLDRVKEAYACLENREHIGKIVVTIPDSHAYRHVRTPVAAAAATPIVPEPAAGPAAAPAQAASRSPELVRLNGGRDGRPVFWFHGALGGVEIYQPLAQEIERPFFGLQARGWMSARAPIVGVRAMAEHYARLVRSVQPEGPYDFGGYSLGGVIAYEVARQVQAAGERVASMVMLDAPDSTHLDLFKFTPQTAMLQAVNTALFSTIASQPERLAEVLVHRDETAPDLGDEAFFEHLVSLAERRGVFKDRDQLRLSVRQAVTLHAAYEVEKFRVDPLARPHEVEAYYFRNRSGRFWGTLESYLTMTAGEVSLDRTTYWSEWERELPNLRIVDVESSSHLTLLLEPASFATIARCCADLYASRASEAATGQRRATL